MDLSLTPSPLDYDEVATNNCYAKDHLHNERYPKKRTGDEFYLQDEHERILFAKKRREDDSSPMLFYARNIHGRYVADHYAWDQDEKPIFPIENGRQVYLLSRDGGGGDDDEFYPYDVRRQTEVYALDENGSPYYAKKANGQEFYATTQNEHGDTVEFVGESGKYIVDARGLHKYLMNRSTAQPLFSTDGRRRQVYLTNPTTGDEYYPRVGTTEIYALDEHKVPYYAKDARGDEFYATRDDANGDRVDVPIAPGKYIVDARGLDQYLMNRSTNRPLFPKDSKGRELYLVDRASGDEYYPKNEEGIEFYAVDENGTPYYAKTSDGKEFYARKTFYGQTFEYVNESGRYIVDDPETGRMRYPMNLTQNIPIYPFDKDRNLVYFRHDTVGEYCPVQGSKVFYLYDEETRRDILPKDRFGKTKYQRNADGVEMYPLDHDSGDEYYRTEGSVEIYAKDASGQNRYARDADGNERYARDYGLSG